MAGLRVVGVFADLHHHVAPRPIRPSHFSLLAVCREELPAGGKIVVQTGVCHRNRSQFSVEQPAKKFGRLREVANSRFAPFVQVGIQIFGRGNLPFDDSQKFRRVAFQRALELTIDIVELFDSLCLPGQSLTSSALFEARQQLKGWVDLRSHYDREVHLIDHGRRGGEGFAIRRIVRT
ncbi:hypothetical protein D9M68_559580 [compost metagenome]